VSFLDLFSEFHSNLFELGFGLIRVCLNPFISA
jgi:hypothetical protein